MMDRERAVLLAVGAVGIASGAHAQPADANDRATSFQAVTGGQHEDVPGGGLLIAAYGVVLVLLLAYVVRLGRLAQQNAADVARLRRDLEAKRGT